MFGRAGKPDAPLQVVLFPLYSVVYVLRSGGLPYTPHAMDAVKKLIEAARSEGVRMRALAFTADDRGADIIDAEADRWFGLAESAEAELTAFAVLPKTT